MAIGKGSDKKAESCNDVCHYALIFFRYNTITSKHLTLLRKGLENVALSVRREVDPRVKNHFDTSSKKMNE